MEPIPRLPTLEHPLDARIMPPQQMLLEIAGGMENPQDIAERYGYTPRAFAQLAATDAYKQQVLRYEAELRASGVTFARKAAMLAEDLLVDVYKMAKGSSDPQQVLEAAKFMARMGRLEPVRESAAATPAGPSTVFTVAFNFGGQQKKDTLVIDGELVRQLNADLGVEDALDQAPAGGIG